MSLEFRIKLHSEGAVSRLDLMADVEFFLREALALLRRQRKYRPSSRTELSGTDPTLSLPSLDGKSMQNLAVATPGAAKDRVTRRLARVCSIAAPVKHSTFNLTRHWKCHPWHLGGPR